jgi:hypothetical protein
MTDIDAIRRNHWAAQLPQGEHEPDNYYPDDLDEPDEDPQLAQVAPAHISVQSSANDDAFPF